MPETPDAYELPEIEGVDPNDLAGSTMTVLRTAAHEAGIKPDAFKKLVTDWHTAQAEEIATFQQEQMALLGPNEDAIKQRVGKVATFLTRTLPEDEREALMAMATTAAGVKALERLMSRAPTAAGSSAPAQPEDTPDTIRQLMNSKAYSGFGSERDPAVVKRVEAFFEKGGKVL